MSHKSQRRRGSLHHESPDAAHEHADTSSLAPTREQAFDAFCTLLAFVGGCGARVLYTQHALPPDVTSAAAYGRRHRALRAAGVAGVWARGKILACTPEAWAHELPRPPRLAVVPTTPAQNLEAEVSAALGIRLRGPK